MIVFLVILVSISTYMCQFVICKEQNANGDDIPTINIRSVSTSSSYSSSNTGHASSSAMARTTWTNRPKVRDDLTCNGDQNATYKECPNSCKSTCSKPNASCGEFCTQSGCQCNDLYLFSDSGKCILPDDCPGGSPCAQNETFVFCNADCSTDYCPVTDDLELNECESPYPCPSGCACKSNYKRTSMENHKCILASDCPPVNCTRQNEEWNPCPQPCSEKCSDLGTEASECGEASNSCDPKCFCKKGFRRNDNDTCVTVAECSIDYSDY